MSVKKSLRLIIILFTINNAVLFAGEYYYHLHDHLGSVRVVVDKNANVVEAFDYYPFGAELRSTVNDDQAANLRFTGKELDKESHIGLYYFGARFYDPSIGRFISVDPLAEFHSPYIYAGNNPLILTDVTGLATYIDRNGWVMDVDDDTDDLGIYQYDVSYWDYDISNGFDKTQGTLIGESLLWNSFLRDGKIENEAFGKIDIGSTENMEFIAETTAMLKIIADAVGGVESLEFYMMNAGNGELFDIKGKDPFSQYRGSLIKPGIYGSARDAGNYMAGIAGNIAGLPLELTLRGTGAFNAAENPSLNRLGVSKIIGQFMLHLFQGPPYGELGVSSSAQRLGWLNYHR